jgi:hypothetical protein
MNLNLFKNEPTNKLNKNMRFILVGALCLVLNNSLKAQTAGSVGIGTTAPYANAALDVSSTTKGVLFPRLTLAERAILTPLLNNAATSRGLLIYNISTSRFNYWDGTQWNDVGLAGAAGAAGADGTIWYAGQGVPSNTTLGKVNDFYLDGITGDVYSKDLSNTWLRFGGANPVNLKTIVRREVSNAAINIPANSAVAQNFTYANAAIGNAALCSPKSALPDGIIISYVRVSAANTIEVKFYNATSAAVILPAGDYELVIF